MFAALALTLTSPLGAAKAERRGPKCTTPDTLSLRPLGSFQTDRFDESAAEIVAHDPRTQRLFVVNAASAIVEVLDLRVPSAPTKLFDFAMSGVSAADGSKIEPGAVANSVSIRDGVLAVAVESSERTEPGWVAFFDMNGRALNALRVGALPDMLSFTPDGKTLLVANEGEPSDDYVVDPEGSVSVIDVRGPITKLRQRDVRTATFAAWDRGEKTLSAEVRVFGPDVSTSAPDGPGRIARNLEPEYLVSDAHSKRAYVTLQEANAIAVLNIAAARFESIWPLGYKDHLEPGNELDVSDRDDEARLGSWPVYGMYQPDAVDAYEWRGQTLLVTANEGDSREWPGYSEVERFRALSESAPLCTSSPRLAAFLEDNEFGIESVSALRDNAALGRLHVTTATGRRADGTCYDDLYAFGTRSFSIWTADGRQLFDSGSDFELITRDIYPEFFNSNHTENTFETRSDDKGPEPEGITLGRIAGRTYAFVGLERIGGIMVYDVTDPRRARFVHYLNYRDFAAEPGTREALDLGPEGLLFIEARDSPIRAPLLVVANEVSGTTTIFRIE